MATTPIATSDIAAQAFSMAELSPISSFSDETPQAQAAAQFFPAAIEMRLEAYDWSFARRFVMLSRVPDPEAAGYDVDPDLPNVFILPTDMLALRALKPEPTHWRRDGEVLRADTEGPLQLRYTRKIDNEAKLPAAFRTSVAAQLAVLFASPWVKSRTRREELRNSIADLHALAVTSDRISASASRMDGDARHGNWSQEAVQ